MSMNEIWATNFEGEMCLLDRKIETHPSIALDAEFPAFARNRHMSEPENLRYEDLVYNVNNSKVIQFGFTLFNVAGEIGGSWQVNFSRKRTKNMIDLERNRNDWVDRNDFVERFHKIILKHRARVRWVTFHGIYDVAYLSSMLMKQEVPSSIPMFVKMVGEAIGTVLYDIKLIAGQSEYLGLEKLSKKLLIERVGQAHQAGSDSLLTAEVFINLCQKIKNHDLINSEGYLFGISLKIQNPGRFYASTSESSYAIERLTVEHAPCLQQPIYPIFRVSNQFNGSQIYYKAPLGCVPFLPVAPRYRVYRRLFYPLHGYIANVHDYRALMIK